MITYFAVRVFFPDWSLVHALTLRKFGAATAAQADKVLALTVPTRTRTSPRGGQCVALVLTRTVVFTCRPGGASIAKLVSTNSATISQKQRFEIDVLRRNQSCLLFPEVFQPSATPKTVSWRVITVHLREALRLHNQGISSSYLWPRVVFTGASGCDRRCASLMQQMANAFGFEDMRQGDFIYNKLGDYNKLHTVRHLLHSHAVK